MNRYLLGTLVLAVATAVLPIQAESGAAGKAAARAMRSHSLKAGHRVNPEILRRDLMRDRATKARALAAERRVFRYTSKGKARQELRKGIAPQSHMTSRAGRGRPLRGEKAQSRYGLPARPQVRETVRLPKGQPVRTNKSLGGGRGVGEITSSKQILPRAIEKVIPLQ